MKSIWGNPLSRFLVIGSGLYLFWYFLYEYWLKSNSALDKWVISNLISLTDGALSLMGYNLWNDANQVDGNFVGIAGGYPLEVGAPCDGLVLHALFLAFIIAFPGPWKHKLWFAPTGVLLVHMVNVLRITSLAMIIHYAPEYLDFNHDYTFTILVYSFVFVLWIFWVKRFSGIGSKA